MQDSVVSANPLDGHLVVLVAFIAAGLDEDGMGSSPDDHTWTRGSTTCLT